MANLERYWYRSSLNLLTFLLLPLAFIFRCAVALRRFLYRKKIFKSHRFSVPIIVVGNITVGGTGKTPFVTWLVQTLRAHGYRPGVVSRGVGGQQQLLPRWVNVHSNPIEVGDEAILLAKRTECSVVIGVDRVAVVKELLDKTDCNVVISDDGLQHYRLARDIEIAIIDGDRRLGNRQFLPAGPLRESPQRLNEVDFVICNRAVGGARNPIFQRGCDMELRGNFLVSVRNDEQKIQIENIQGKKIHALAAIGNPQRFFNSLRDRNIEVIEHVFPDHYIYHADDLVFADDLMIVMTEKDAVKCRHFANEKCWYLPVDVKIDPILSEQILQKLEMRSQYKTV